VVANEPAQLVNARVHHCRLQIADWDCRLQIVDWNCRLQIADWS
jgi:hypothetical protein